jgi:methyl coenzyme M reductase gamma subunit
MARIALALAFTLLMATSSSAQQSLETREQALEEISRVLAEINEVMPATVALQTGAVSTSVLENAIDRALALAMDLRDRLAGNPHIRVGSVQVGIPWGVSVEFTLPEPERDQ